MNISQKKGKLDFLDLGQLKKPTSLFNTIQEQRQQIQKDIMNNQTNSIVNSSSLNTETETLPLEATHTVQPGETLSKIAKDYETSTESLMESNKDIQNPDEIAVGQVLTIPNQKRESEEENIQATTSIRPSIRIQLIGNHQVTVENQYIQPNFVVAYYESKLRAFLATKNGTRNKVALAAIFLATQFPKIPYFWGGGHTDTKEEMTGINQTWGIDKPIVFGGDDYYIQGEQFPNSLDCSGFVTWCMLNGGYEVDPYIQPSGYCLGSEDLKKLGPSKSLTDPSIFETVQVGDVGYMSGHVGIVIDVNEDKKEITFAHVSGSGYGMNITTMSTETGEIVNDILGAIPKIDKNGNPIPRPNRIGNKYFTDIISISYPD